MSTHQPPQTDPVDDPLDELAAAGTTAAPSAAGDDATPPPAADVLALEARVTQLSDQLLRALADVQNLRRRSEREKSEVHATAGASVLLELLPVLDELDRAASHAPPELADHDWTRGVLHIRSNLEAALKRLGVERFGATGDAYDAERHEAVARGDGAENTLVQVLESGYLQGDRVLRPAKVVVGSGDTTTRADPAPAEKAESKRARE